MAPHRKNIKSCLKRPDYQSESVTILKQFEHIIEAQLVLGKDYLWILSVQNLVDYTAKINIGYMTEHHHEWPCKVSI